MARSDITGIKLRAYSNFRGVDFTGGVVPLYRSPEAKNMWRDYKDDDCIQTRPGMTLLDNFDGAINGLFFLEKNNTMHCLVHAGVKLYEWTNYPTLPANKTVLRSGMNPFPSQSFIYDNTLFIKDGINYLEYNGTQCTEVVGTVPYTSYYRNPDGSVELDNDTDIDTINQPINLLTSLRKNRFIGKTGETVYHLDDTNLDDVSVFVPTVVVNTTTKTITTDFTYDKTAGTITFVTTEPGDGDIVVVTYSKTISGNADKIKNCKILAEFDNRIFYSGNPNYPNTVFHCELNDPRYIRENAYYNCGIDLSNIKALIPGNGVLWVVKKINQNSSSLYYMMPTLNSAYGKIYPSSNGSVSLGCVSTGINFNDDIVYFSLKGLEAVNSSSMYSEQILAHRSSNVDAKLLSEPGYEDIKLAEYKGYLMCLVNSHVYLADSRQFFKDSAGQAEYEWFYWELPNTITFIKEYRDVLYLGNAKGDIYFLSGVATEDDTTDMDGETPIDAYDIESVWTTKKDDFDYPAYTKTTNKRGNVVNLKKMNNNNIKMDTIVDGVLKEKRVLKDAKGYAPYRIKDKKFKEIQLKFSSNKPFGLFSCTLEGFIAGYIKR